MKNVCFLLLAMFMFCCKTANQNSADINHKDSIKKKQPNVIVVIIDDAGYADFGFMGSKDLQTPNIDKLAKSGAVFTDAHVSATVCAPSRAGLMTGKYQQRFGFEANGTGDKNSGDVGLSDDVVTMADVFKENGYKTFALGKWHLGGGESDHPNNRGFDEFYGFLTGSRSYFPLKNPNNYRMLQHNGKRVEFEGYMTDILGEQSVKYIEENKDKPFFMYLSYNAVHTPMEAKKEDLKKFEGHPRQKLAAMTWSLDKNIGKLQQKLKDLNIEESTLIYFLSDNGGASNNSSTNGQLKGWKGNKFEGGHRVPFVVSWKGQIKGGQTFKGLSSSLDIFTTSMAAANIKKPNDLVLDGANLLPYLKGEKSGDPHDKLFWRKLEEAGARIGDYKMIRLRDYGATLYNLEKDLGETINLESTNQSEFKLLDKELKNWETEIMQPLWVEGRDWMDVTYHIHKSLMQNKKPEYTSPGKMKRVLKKRNEK